MAEIFVNRFQFVLLVVMFAFTLIALYVSRKGKQPFGGMRKITAMEHLEEAVGRAAEMGKGVFFTQGTGTLASTEAGQVLAGVSVMGKVGEYCAKLGVPIKVICREGVTQNIDEVVLREAYTKAGVPDAYNPSMVVFGTTDMFAYTNFCAEWILKEKPASTFFVGYFGGSSVYMAESSARMGCMSIGGNFYVFGVICDYYMPGEELFAAGAYASGDSEQVGTIAAQDVTKIVILVLMIAGLAAAYVGSKVIAQLLAW